MLINSVLIVNATTSTEINSAVGDNFKNYDNINTLLFNSSDEGKKFCEASINDDFYTDSVIVILKNDESLKFKKYDINDFPNVNASSVNLLTEYTYENIKNKFDALISNYVINENTNFSLIENYINNKDLLSYLQKNINNKLLEQKTNGFALFSNKIKSIEYKININNYIKTLDNKYDYLKNYDYNNFHTFLKLNLNTTNKQQVLDTIKLLETQDNVYMAFPNYKVKFDTNNSNTSSSNNNQWYLDKIDYYEALSYNNSATNKITVGIIDSGINANHAYLKNNIDYTLSKSFLSSDTNPFTDNVDHGTCVAGVIGADQNNENGVSGICSNVNLVSLKISNTSDFSDLSSVKRALDYAQSNNISIVNCSFSTLGYSLNSFDEMEEIYGDYKGIIVCSSGNEGYDIDNLGNFYSFPSALPYDNIISVAAIDEKNNLSSFSNGNSNYGKTSVDIAAPGSEIYTTASNGGYRNFSGTSIASPIVTGIVAQIKSIHPDISNSQLRTFILNNTVKVSSLTNKISTGGIVNLNNILSNINDKNFIVKYNANSGSGTMQDTTVYYNVNKKLNKNTFAKLDYRFVGWQAYRHSDNKWLFTDNNGTNKWYVDNQQPSNYTKFIYNDCAKIAKTSNINGDIITMYAQWEKLQLGDINLDGNISIIDVTLLQKYLSGTLELTYQQTRMSDVNKDGYINILDVTEIQKIISAQ